MTNYREDSFHMSDEELRHLEDEMSRTPSRDADHGHAGDLPSPLYRIRTLHSNETYFAHIPAMERKPQPVPVSSVGETPENLNETTAADTIADSIADISADTSADFACLECAGSGSATVPDAVALEAAEPGAVAPVTVAQDTVGSARLEPDASDTSTMRYFDKTGTLPRGGMVVAPTRYGRDLCEVQGIIRDVSVVNSDELVLIDRIATTEDLEHHRTNLEKEATAFEYCRVRINARNLAMKLVSAHYLLEEPKVLFYFSAESRVDFRELVKDLVSFFKMRIELRQIGVRDEARVTGGCGVCGRILCCHGVSDKLTPVSIKMAKDQNLSLNSLKISGPCGRLLCCLAYEYNFYRDARRELPNEGARFMYEGVLFRVIEVNALSSTVKVAGEDGRILNMPAVNFKYSEGRWQVREQV